MCQSSTYCLNQVSGKFHRYTVLRGDCRGIEIHKGHSPRGIRRDERNLHLIASPKAAERRGIHPQVRIRLRRIRVRQVFLEIGKPVTPTPSDGSAVSAAPSASNRRSGDEGPSSKPRKGSGANRNNPLTIIGKLLSRRSAEGRRFGHEPTNWNDTAPTAGRLNLPTDVLGEDSDGAGLSDTWEIRAGSNPRLRPCGRIG